MTPRDIRALAEAHSADLREQRDFLCRLAAQFYNGASFAFQRRQISASAEKEKHVEPILATCEMPESERGE